ncbi:MAG: hypothetical protein LBG60_06560 [Bifidobacteriaceae bacterium]|nr:hypothetical protein [Bifidobacteriaceae bacterium]
MDSRIDLEANGRQVLGEVVRRVSGGPLSQFAAEEFFEPLGMDAYLALPAGELGRVVPIRGKGGNPASPLYLNRDRSRAKRSPRRRPCTQQPAPWWPSTTCSWTGWAAAAGRRDDRRGLEGLQ